MAEQCTAPQKEAPTKARVAHRSRFWLMLSAGLVIAAALAFAAWYSQSAHVWLRARIVAKIEQLTGCRVEVGELHWNLTKLEFEAHDLILHGREAPGETPYISVSRLYLRAKILSLLEHKFGVHYIELDRPAVHLIVYPDGSTNQPELPRRGKSSGIDTLFELSADRAELRNGSFLYNAKLTPLDFSGNDIGLLISYDQRRGHYQGQFHLGKLDLKLNGVRPLSAAADLQFTLWRNLLTVRSFKLTSGRSNVQASGDLHNFTQPKLDLHFDSSLDVEQLAAAVRFPEVHGGIVNLSGDGILTIDDFSFTGRVVAKKVDFRFLPVGAPNAPVAQGTQEHDGALNADFAVTKRKFALTNIVARLWGGTATGNAEISDWMHVVPANAMTERRTGEARIGAAVQRGSVKLKATDIHVSSIASVFASPQMPLDQMKLEGIAHGTVDAHWVRSPMDALVDIVADADPAADLSRGETPLRGSTDGTYSVASGFFEMRRISLATNATRVTAVGKLSAFVGDLNLSADTSNLRELQPIVDAISPDGVPVDVAGTASFFGTLKGKLLGPTITGTLQLTNFDYLYAPDEKFPTSSVVIAEHNSHVRRTPHKQPSNIRRIPLDFGSAAIVSTPSRIVARNGILRRGPMSLTFDADSQLTEGIITGSSAFSLHANATGLDTREVQRIAGSDYPLTGTMRIGLSLAGTPQNQHGSGGFQILNASIRGEPFQRIAADLQFSNTEAQLSNIDATHGVAHIKGTAGYNFANANFRFDLRGGGFNLANLQQLQMPRTRLSGALDFSASGSGTQEAPSINFDLNLHNLVLNGERVADFSAKGETNGENLTLVAHSSQPNNITAEGEIRLRGDFPGKLQISATQFDVDPLLREFLKGHITGPAQLTGQLNVEGSLKQPHELAASARVTQFGAELENLHIENRGDIVLSSMRQVARIDQLHLIAPDTDLVASGTADLGSTHALNIHANGKMNLKLIQTLNPDYISAGTLKMNLDVGGTANKPVLLGEATVSGGAFAYTDLPNGLSDINGSLVFNQDRLVVQKMTAKTGGGSLVLGGFIGFGGDAISFNVEAHADEMRLRYPEGISSLANSDLRLQGTAREATLSGQVLITRFSITPAFDLATFLARNKQPVEIVNPNSPANNVRLDIHVLSTPELQVQTSLAKLTGDVDLRIRGTAVKPALLGRVNIIEGQVLFNGTTYHLARGSLLFINPTSIQPVVDLDATTRVRDYDITLGFHGPTDKLSTNYRSDPPLATADIIALLAFGRTREESALQPGANASFSESASNAILGQALNTAVSSRVQKLFGVSRIKIDPQIGGSSTNASTARVTIEQQVSRSMTVTYITDVSRGNQNQQIIQAEYNVSKNVAIVAVRDQYGVLGFEVRIRQRKR